MRDAKELIHEAMVIEADNAANRTNNETFFAERDAAIAELESEREDAYAFALALAVLTWLADTFEADRELARATFAVYALTRISAERPAYPPRANAHVTENVSLVDFTQRQKARAELDAWIQAGIAVTGATGDDGRVRVRQAEEGECVVGYTFVDDAADFNPLTPEESAAINAKSRAISAGPVNISAAFFQRPKAKP